MSKFRMEVAVSLFIAWAIMLLLTFRTKYLMFEIMMPLIMIALVIYLFVWSIIALFSKEEKEEKDGDSR